MTRKKMVKPKYESPYKTELVIAEDGRSLLIQYRSECVVDRQRELERRKQILQKRPRNEDFRLTEYFEKRSQNILQQLFTAASADDIYDIVIKSINVTYSMHFRYRDFKDILETKMSEMVFDDQQNMILEYVKTSLFLNDVIAAKIGAISKKISEASSE